MAAGVALCAGGWFLWARLQRFPAWDPTGHDWDQWYATAMSTKTDLRYPNNRWPLSGWVMLATQAVLPVPPHVGAIAASILAGATAVGATFWLAARLVGWPAACVAAALAAGHPEVRAGAGNIGPYALWACASAVAALAVMEAVRTDRTAWWGGCGLAWAATLAVLEKGLGIGLALGGLIVGVHTVHAWVRRRGLREAWRAPAATGAAFAALAVAYAAFPRRLWSLDEMMALAATGRVGTNGYSAGEAGYVFGQRMDPLTLWHTLQAGRAMAAPTASEAVLDRIVVPDTPLRVVAALGALAGIVAILRHARSRPHLAVGWLAVGAVLAGTAPAFTAAVPQARFLLPGLVLGTVVLVAPFAHLPARYGLFAWLAIPLCLAPQSPWTGRFWRPFPEPEDEEWRRRRLLAQVYQETRTALPDAPVDVVAPLAGGLLLVDGRGGRVHDRPDATGLEVAPDHGVVFPVDAAGPTHVGADAGSLAATLTGRVVLAEWPTLDARRTLVLVSPVEAEPRPQ